MNKLIFFTLILSSFIATSCKDAPDPNCGCKDEVQFTIRDSDKQKGYLYVNDLEPHENIPDFKYGIWFSEENCSNCMHHFLVCNEDFVSHINEDLKYPGIEVILSGEAKKLCEDPWRPAGTTFNRIILSKIEPYCCIN